MKGNIKKINKLSDELKEYLENGKWYTIEELSKRFNTTNANVHRAFTLLCKLPGWSIRPHNIKPGYYWAPTIYIVRKGKQ